MIKTIFTFFQVQIKSLGRHSVKFVQSSFGIRPETFNAVNVVLANGKNIRRMINAKMFALADINQSIIAAPAVRVNHRIQGYLAANDVLQCLLGGVRRNFGKDRAITFVNSKDNGLAACTASALSANSSRAKIGFINFDLATGKRRCAHRFFGNSISNFQVNLINRFARQISQKSRFLSGQIKRKILDNLSGFALANFSIPIISV